MNLTGVRLNLGPRSDAEPGFFITSVDNHPLLRWFSRVETDPKTDFSGTKKGLEEFLDQNHPEGSPHTVTFNPNDPVLMVGLGIIEAHIQVSIQPQR